MNISIMPMLAVISGGGLVNLLVWIFAIALICYLLWWVIGYVGLPEPFAKIARAIVAFAAVIFLINAILQVAGGHGFIAF